MSGESPLSSWISEAKLRGGSHTHTQRAAVDSLHAQPGETYYKRWTSKKIAPAVSIKEQPAINSNYLVSIPLLPSRSVTIALGCRWELHKWLRLLLKPPQPATTCPAPSANCAGTRRGTAVSVPSICLLVQALEHLICFVKPRLESPSTWTGLAVHDGY